MKKGNVRTEGRRRVRWKLKEKEVNGSKVKRAEKRIETNVGRVLKKGKMKEKD